MNQAATNLTSATRAPSAAGASAAPLRAHFADVVLPLWRGAGFDDALQLPYEAMSAESGAHRSLPVTRYRAMACARQLYVFTQMDDLPHARTLFQSLVRHFQDTQSGGWFFSVDAQGAPLDTTKDLYTHAFVVFACAAYAAKSGDRDALKHVYDTSALIETRFAAPHDLLNASLDARFENVIGTPVQNPLMHLTEAWLTARKATGSTHFDASLMRLARAIAATFVHRQTGCIAELPIGTQHNRIEPGHQFEWFWLVKQGGALFDGSGLDGDLTRAFDFAEAHGVDADTGGVAAAIDESGTVIDGTQRIWAQTEYLRALATRDDDRSRRTLSLQAARFAERFLHTHGWFEVKTPEGELARADMPSTTPYHLLTAYDALPR